MIKPKDKTVEELQDEIVSIIKKISDTKKLQFYKVFIEQIEGVY